ncbi:uncharacterized protein LOC109610080 [Camponotus floridanus]|uniref:uncharacterized protein LOC109610080 n=1 Tax=Camponotus floridanus TaxID=104421 RepID=UPI0009716009|nr:uncharacterized protein LOC109610080 [Camponotus floridanus]
MRSVPFVRRVVDGALDASRRKRETGRRERDGNGGGRESEERIERERMRGRGTKIVKRRRARKRETIGDVYRRRASARQTSTRGSVAAAGLGVDLSRDDRDASRGRLSASRRLHVTHDNPGSLGLFLVLGALAVVLRPGTRREEAASSDDVRRVAPGRPRDADAMRRRSARPGTSHVNVVWVFTTAHTNACTLWMHGGYIKSGWIYRGDREGRLLITRRVDQPLSLRLCLSFLSLPLSLSLSLPLRPGDNLSLYLAPILSSFLSLSLILIVPVPSFTYCFSPDCSVLFALITIDQSLSVTRSSTVCLHLCSLRLLRSHFSPARVFLFTFLCLRPLFISFSL